MKKIISITIAAFAFMAIAVTGCKDKPCDVVVCANSGVCADGICNCQLGYEGIHCETAMRDKYIGFYNVIEDGTLTGSTQYNVNIEAGDRINEVKITNFYNNEPFKTNKVIGIVKNDSITIAQQFYPDGSIIQGYGFIVGTNTLNQHYYQKATVEMFYSVTNPAGQINKFGFPDDGISSKWAK